MKRKLFIAAPVTRSVFIASMGILIAVGITGCKGRSSNEASAIKTLKTIAEQQMYYNAHHRDSFGTFDEMLRANLLDTRFAGSSPSSSWLCLQHAGNSQINYHAGRLHGECRSTSD